MFNNGQKSSQGTNADWQNVFYIAAGVMAVGCLSFLIFGTTDRQEWARENEEKKDSTNAAYDNAALSIREDRV